MGTDQGLAMSVVSSRIPYDPGEEYDPTAAENGHQERGNPVLVLGWEPNRAGVSRI